MKYEDILYEKDKGKAIITINRPKVLNAFRAKTLYEMIDAIIDSWKDNEIGVLVLTGAGERAFSTGGDQKEKKSKSKDLEKYLPVGQYVAQLHYLLRNIPKPVIAAVKGYAIGGGNVLQVVCDLTIAAENAIFGQVGPKVGSVDAGFGTACSTLPTRQKRA